MELELKNTRWCQMVVVNTESFDSNKTYTVGSGTPVRQWVGPLKFSFQWPAHWNCAHWNDHWKFQWGRVSGQTTGMFRCVLTDFFSSLYTGFQWFSIENIEISMITDRVSIMRNWVPWSRNWNTMRGNWCLKHVLAVGERINTCKCI